MNRGELILLAVDIGNTNVTIGAFKGELLVCSWRISTDRRRMADEYRPMLGELLRSAGFSYDQVTAAVMASVVPPVASEVAEAFSKEQVHVVALGTQDFGVPIRYEPQSSVGADRLANAVAVREKYGRPAIIVDLGTATTLDVLDAHGAYIGGAIAPGIEPSVEGLFARAFQLPRLALQAPEHAIGKTTVESIRSGTVFGWAALVDGLIKRFMVEIDGKPIILATGGMAALVAPQSRYIEFMDLDLTLLGLRLAYEAMQPRTS